jgi:hypothetical protein
MTPMIDLTGVELLAVLDEIKALVPVVLPVIIGFIAFRKGLAFIKGTLRCVNLLRGILSP